MKYSIRKYENRLYVENEEAKRTPISILSARLFISAGLAENLSTVDFNNTDFVVRNTSANRYIGTLGVIDLLQPEYEVFQKVYGFAAVTSEPELYTTHDVDDEDFIEDDLVDDAGLTINDTKFVSVALVDRVEAEYLISKGAENLSDLKIDNGSVDFSPTANQEIERVLFVPDEVGDYGVFKETGDGNLKLVKTVGRTDHLGHDIYDQASFYENSTIFRVDTRPSQEKKSTFWQKITDFFALLFTRR